MPPWSRPGRSPQPTAEAPDYVSVAVRNRASRLKLDGSPRLLADAVLLVYRSGKPLLLGVLLCIVVNAALVLGQLLVVRELLSRLLAAGRPEAAGLVAVLALVVALVVLGQLVSNVVTVLQRVLGQRVMRSAMADVLALTSRTRLESFEDHEFYEHLGRVQQNGLQKPLEVVQALVGLLNGAVVSAILIAFVVSVEPLLVPMLALAALPAYLASRYEGRLEFSFALGQVTRTRQRGYLVTLLSAPFTARELRSFQTARSLTARWERSWQEYLSDLHAHCRARLGLALTGTLASGVLTVVVAAFIASWLQAGVLPVASAGAAVLALRLLGARANETARGLAGVLEARPFLDDRAALLEEWAGAAEDDGEALPPPGAIELHAVGFRYPSGTGQAVADVTLRIEAGQVVAVVGHNGSGKTTLTAMLAGLFAPTSGRLLWDGQEVDEGLLPAVRSHVCAVFQDFVRYALPARENITLDDEPDEHRLRAAVEAAGAQFLLDLPKGLDTVLSKEYRDGRALSVGQWQRVAIARAFYRDKPLLVLDEPTSALDARAEHDLFSRVRDLWQGRTVVFVSHRLSSARLADTIVFLHEGRVVEQGSHDELIRLGGRYADLFELQARGYRDQVQEVTPA